MLLKVAGIKKWEIVSDIIASFFILVGMNSYGVHPDLGVIIIGFINTLNISEFITAFQNEKRRQYQDLNDFDDDE